MGESKDIIELVEESDEFEQCSDCGRYLARTSNHRCQTDEQRQCPPNRAERNRRASADTRREDTLVGVFSRNGGTTYAYHDLTNGEPRCGCHHHTDPDELEVVTLSRAKERGRSPCRSCRRIRRA
ncbi:hypothetical protein [Halorussus salinisoli]|uniref:hypothetical protein n=1 Tax=Halorussus salinisoli TaxID=2558242 RepID=UPI0010C17FB4|nr:hypothetical protein [Halorussus salinisoli]